MYVKDGATILADILRTLGEILSRPLFYLLLGLSKLTQRYRQELVRI